MSEMLKFLAPLVASLEVDSPKYDLGIRRKKKVDRIKKRKRKIAQASKRRNRK